MPIGLNRENDTPIGGASEFRGNLQAPMSVWSPTNVPAWDGTKFVPAAGTGLFVAYGGLASNGIPATAADGSLIQNWDQVMPIGGTPLQLTVDAVAGTVTIAQDGVYQIDFGANVTGLVNNQEYAFQLAVNGTPQSWGAIISGSNTAATGSVQFSLQFAATAAQALGVAVTNGASSLYEIVSSSLSVRRIG